MTICTCPVVTPIDIKMLDRVGYRLKSIVVDTEHVIRGSQQTLMRREEYR